MPPIELPKVALTRADIAHCHGASGMVSKQKGFRTQTEEIK